MSAAFSGQAAEALKDASLQAVLGQVTATLNERRDQATAALSGYEGLKDRAREVKLALLGSLSERLLEFEAKAQAQGATVHWAADAAEARAIIRGILKKAGAKSVVKSKSMVTEEIELNHALEAEGLSVVETDLGEYVAQLRKEKPSHIILPIIHLNKGQVAETFYGPGAKPEQAEVAALVEEARLRMRKDFEAADAGITGANFAVASEGALCIVSNEGNARFVTSLPRVHIAITGIEKVVADLGQLGLFLRLLARSATGQRLTVYSNLLWPGRDAGDGAGPRESHVVLLDNGRSRLLNSPAAEMLACIRCGACLNTCPIYQHAGGHAYGATYPGPMGSLLSPALGAQEGRDLAFASTLCGACREVCPVRIDIPKLLLLYRGGAGFGERQGWIKTLAFKGFGFVASRPQLYAIALGLARVLGVPVWGSRLGWLIPGWSRHRALPKLAPKSFQELWQEQG